MWKSGAGMSALAEATTAVTISAAVEATTSATASAGFPTGASTTLTARAATLVSALFVPLLTSRDEL